MDIIRPAALTERAWHGPFRTGFGEGGESVDKRRFNRPSFSAANLDGMSFTCPSGTAACYFP